MNEKKIDDSIIHKLIELADWAPTHGHTEPWRFVVFSNDNVKMFCEAHANMYRSNIPTDKFETAKYEKLLHNGDKCSHIIAVYMKRGNNPKITAVEELCAVASAVQNILLGASALDIAALWSSGGFTYHQAMKKYFELNDEDEMIGFLYLGYTNEKIKSGTRIVPLHEKIKLL